ncbi:polysaccharide biosynthesis/export family protein [Hyphomicrobium sp. CS1BSMeth3]|uniref:polysaccharide biosynthesis/export family protein n=1 Tax=Hyphomicrobium sp. CS1BSMeth3 TaxID=1892844 RepID=UPI0015774A41|nr:polysaccharide biosynthesis/export family protein [Hyphomicrobium sp. CS1BSMeth3]
MVGPGDVLQVTVFEIGTALFTARGGLALASADASGGAPVAAGETLPPIKVDQRGGVTLPYVGRIAVAGMTPAQIQTVITQRLKPNSQHPQAVVSVRDQIWSTVMISGEAKQPGRVPLVLRNERLLDAIAKAGGSSVPAQDTLVRITRGGRVGTVWLDELTTAAANNILVVPQDQIQLLNRPRTFTVFGATDKVSEMPFLRPDVSLAEAIARAGGPSDNRADPSAVFVFRYDRASVDGRPLPDARPMIYRLDLTRPESYFLAQTFWMRPRDVIYIANAASVQPAKLLQILNLIFQPIYTAKVLAQ